MDQRHARIYANLDTAKKLQQAFKTQLEICDYLRQECEDADSTAARSLIRERWDIATANLDTIVELQRDNSRETAALVADETAE